MGTCRLGISVCECSLGNLQFGIFGRDTLGWKLLLGNFRLETLGKFGEWVAGQDWGIGGMGKVGLCNWGNGPGLGR